jgi:hypothetical protein
MAMSEQVKKIAVKFVETTGRWADIELFTEEDAWDFMRELLNDYARPRGRLSDGQIIIMRDLGAALGIKPGSPLRFYAPGLVRAFGATPLSDEEMTTLTQWVYAQVNAGGDFEPARKPPVALNASSVGDRSRLKRR